MTREREKAIEILKEIIDEGWLISDFDKCIAIDACEMAIEGIKALEILDKIKTEIEKQEKWLLQAGYNQYNVDIAFHSIKAIKSALEESEET